MAYRGKKRGGYSRSKGRRRGRSRTKRLGSYYVARGGTRL